MPVRIGLISIKTLIIQPYVRGNKTHADTITEILLKEKKIKFTKN